MLFLLCGLIIGAAQFFLTVRTVSFFVSKRIALGAAFMILKSLLYVGFFALIIYFLKSGGVWIGAGYGAGMICASVVRFIVTLNKTKKNGR